jgi:hypothetical protein
MFRDHDLTKPCIRLVHCTTSSSKKGNLDFMPYTPYIVHTAKKGNADLQSALLCIQPGWR